MRKAAAIVAVPALLLTLSNALAADVTTNDEKHYLDWSTSPIRLVPQNNMFDGINLTEQQRQQLRDLMQQARHDRSPISLDDVEQLHELIIAEKFDRAAFESQIEKVAQAEVARQTEMAQIRNQMYHLLTPQQQVILQQNYELRLKKLRELVNSQQATPLQAARSTSSAQ